MCSTELAYAATLALCDVRYLASVCRYDVLHDVRRSYAISLRACYALSGTDLAYAAICLRVCYTLARTDLAKGAIGLRDVRFASSLCACYAMSGTRIAYFDLPYAMPGTVIAYAGRTLRYCRAEPAHLSVGLQNLNTDRQVR
eukprot:119595-Rhodomonas_salina.2